MAATHPQAQTGSPFFRKRSLYPKWKFLVSLPMDFRDGQDALFAFDEGAFSVMSLPQ